MSQKPKRRIFLREYKAISRALSTYEDINLLADHIVKGICRSFGVKGCSILILDDHLKQLFCLASHGISEGYLSKGPLFMDNSQSAFSRGEPVFVEDMRNDPRVQYPEAALREGIVSMLSVPIVSHGSTIGLIRIYNSDAWALHDEDTDAFLVLAEHLGLVIENNGLRNFLEQVKTAMGNLPLRMLDKFFPENT